MKQFSLNVFLKIQGYLYSKCMYNVTTFTKINITDYTLKQFIYSAFGENSLVKILGKVFKIKHLKSKVE